MTKDMNVLSKLGMLQKDEIQSALNKNTWFS